MNRAPVLKSHTAGRAGLKPTRRKKNYSSKDKQEGGRGGSSSTPPLVQVEVFSSYVEKCSSAGDELKEEMSVTVRSPEEGVLGEEGAVSPSRIYLLSEVMQ